MRGKKKDSAFIAQYIQFLDIPNKTPKNIADKAIEEIDSIDLQLSNLETLKKRRSQLCDVVETFGSKKDKSQDRAILDSFIGVK